MPLKSSEFDFDEQQLKLYSESQQIESFRFVEWDAFSAEKLTLPIDKIVATIVKAKFWSMSETVFFEQDIFLENDVVILTALKKDDFETLSPIAFHPAIWKVGINNLIKFSTLFIYDSLGNF